MKIRLLTFAIAIGIVAMLLNCIYFRYFADSVARFFNSTAPDFIVPVGIFIVLALPWPITWRAVREQNTWILVAIGSVAFLIAYFPVLLLIFY